MHIALGHLRGRARAGWGDTRPWGVNMRPFHLNTKSSERLIQFFAWMAELAYREPQYLQILDLPHKTVSQTRAQSARLSLFIQTLNDYRISPRPHIRLYRRITLPIDMKNLHHHKKKPPVLAPLIASSFGQPALECVGYMLTRTLPLNSACIVALDALGRWVRHRTAVSWHLL